MMEVHQNQQQQDYQDQQRMMYQQQLQEEEYNRSIASPGGSAASRMSRQQLVQRRLERRRQERRLRTNELQSQTTHQPPPPPPQPPGTSPRSIMKKNSSYQSIPDQQYFHSHQRQPQHTPTSSNYSSDSSANYISPPTLNRKQPFPHGPSHPNQSNYHVGTFTQNGVVIDRTAFRPTGNGLRLPHESPSDEWSRNGNSVNHSRVQHSKYQNQYQEHPQLYVPDTPLQNSASYGKSLQMRGNNRQPNWQELDRQRLMYQKQMTTRQRVHMGQQQQNVSYVSDDEETDNNRRVNASFNSQTKTPIMDQNRSRSLSRERQLPRRWRHNRSRGMSPSSSANTPLPTEDSPQFQYTPRSRLAVSESLGQPEVNTPMSSHSLGVRSNPLQNGRHGWRQHNSQHHYQHNQHQPQASEYGWERQGPHRQSQPGLTHHDQYARKQNLVSPSRSEASNYSDRDQETASVASIREAWEGRVEQQRGRTQTASHDRRHNTGEIPLGAWAERDNRVSQLHQGEPRLEQKRNYDNKWRRNSSLPPPERRRGLRQAEYFDADGYQSDGGYRSQPYRVDVDAAHVSIHDARRRLWDQNERLRAVLPQTHSFDSIDDVRHHRSFPSIGLASPGNVSAISTGSALFKSKFVHAAALATQKRDLPVDRGHQNSFHFPNKIEEESPKGSSLITDSTADTTAPSSNHTSHAENARGSQFTKQTTATMPSIAEARPISDTPPSVADLIARINAVSRDNPAEALARIDSIIKGESAGDVKPRQQNSGVSSLFNFDAGKNQTVSKNDGPNKESATNDPPTASQDDDDDHEDHDDPSLDESVFSSSESTVSSMTNPTYQSVCETRRKKSSTNPTESDRKAKAHSPQVVTTRVKEVEYPMSVDNQEPGSNRGGDDGPLTKAKLQSFNNDNDWTSPPQSDFFNEYGGFRNASTQAVASSRTMQIKKSGTSREQVVPKRPATPDLMNAVSSAFSDVNISFGDTGATRDLLAKAFSDVTENGQAKNQNVLANAFSDVDINMEQKTVTEQKTVRQRRKELELLSKSFTGSSGNAANMNQNNSSGFDWDREEEPKNSPTKQKKRIEPTLRLKSNKKLTQKFANLVKAFEHF